MLNGEMVVGESGVGRWLGRWGWGMFAETRRVWLMTYVGVLLFLVLVGVLFGWVEGLGRFAGSLPLGWVVLFLWFLVEWLGVYGGGCAWIHGWGKSRVGFVLLFWLS